MRRAALLLLALLLSGAGSLGAQSVDIPPPAEVELPPDSVDRVSPLGAFLRAVVLPSWGHATLGSHRRGSFYLAAEGGTAWMLLKTASRRSSARDMLATREAVARAEFLVSAEEPTEDEIEAALDADPRVEEARRLVDAREGQFEDWVAMGIFLTFLSGADAFVSAHLRDFPDPIDVQVGPSPDGGVQVSARVRLGWE